MELFHANKQWATRPQDERFASLQGLYDATRGYFESAVESQVPYDSLRVEAIDGEVSLVGRSGQPARFTHWGFGQAAALVGAPAGYLRQLPATLACQNLNHGLKGRGEDKDDSAKLLLQRNGSMLVRAITSDKYARIWNWQLAARLLELEASGMWTPAVPDIRAFRGAEPALYASDHDMFAFMRSTDRVIAEPGSTSPLWRGVIVENSEVGAGKLKFTRFLYREMCGNHIIWGASKVMEVGFVHVGAIADKWGDVLVTVKKWADESAAADEAMVERAQRVRLGNTTDEVLDAIFGKVDLSRKALAAGLAAHKPEEDGDPLTVWGVVQGLTRHSQTIRFEDERKRIDREAGKIMTIDF